MRLRRGTCHERNGAPLHSEGSAHSCRVFALGVVYFKPVVEFYGLSLWLPTMIKSFGLSSMQTGVLCSLSTIGMVLWTRQSDTTSKRRLHMVLPCVVGAIWSAHGRRHSLADGVFPVANRRRLQHLPIASMLLAVAHSNDDRLGGRWRRAVINAIADPGPFVGPHLVGLVKDLTATFTGGLYLLAVAVVIVILLGHDLRLEQIPPGSGTVNVTERTLPNTLS